MKTRGWTLRLLCSCVLLSALPTALGRSPATQPAAPANDPGQWGIARAGLQAAIQLRRPAALGGALKLDIRLRNVGDQAVQMPPAKDLFAWLFLVQKDAGAVKAYFTAKVHLAAKTNTNTKNFPQVLAGGKVHSFGTIDLAGSEAFTYRRGLKVAGGYPVAPRGSEPPATAGTCAQVLRMGSAKVRLMLYLPDKNGSPRLLRSNTLTIEIGPPKFGKLSAGARKKFLADLLKRFDSDAWSAKQAHGTAVKVGPDIVEDLASAVMVRKRPAHSRMWLATALCDIRSDNKKAIDTLIALLDETLHGVRNVVGYHGPKQRNARLDKALIREAATNKKPTLTAWIVRGFGTFRKDVPEKLIEAGLASDEPKARAAAAGALAKKTSDRRVEKLLKLLKDSDQQVRGVAAASLAKIKAGTPAVIGALIAALDMPGEMAHYRICSALLVLTGKKIPYDPAADKAVKSKTVRAWKDWWRRRRNNPG